MLEGKIEAQQEIRGCIARTECVQCREHSLREVRLIGRGKGDPADNRERQSEPRQRSRWFHITSAPSFGTGNGMPP